MSINNFAELSAPKKNKSSFLNAFYISTGVLLFFGGIFYYLFDKKSLMQIPQGSIVKTYTDTINTKTEIAAYSSITSFNSFASEFIIPKQALATGIGLYPYAYIQQGFIKPQTNRLNNADKVILIKFVNAQGTVQNLSEIIMLTNAGLCPTNCDVINTTTILDTISVLSNQEIKSVILDTANKYITNYKNAISNSSIKADPQRAFILPLNDVSPKSSGIKIYQALSGTNRELFIFNTY
jgi:hypothetical protein